MPVDYILKADLRINGGEFEKNLLDDADATTGRLDTRFSGPSMDPLSKEASYDPQSAAISSAYVSAFNDYVRRVLKYGQDKTYKDSADLWKTWNFLHQPPGETQPVPQATNTMPDLANAMKYNPQLKLLVTGGYFDLATPFYEGVYEIHHLPIPAKLRGNVTFHYYPSGHMVYAHRDSLKVKATQTGLLNYFDVVFSSHSFGVPKEHPSFWQQLETALGFDPQRTLFVDDSHSVLRAAKNHGIAHIFAISKPDSAMWKEAAMVKIGTPCWIATTWRVVKLRPSR